MSHRIRLATLSVALLLAACGDGTEPPAAAGVARLELANELPVPAYVGRSLAPRVRALDAEGRAVVGVTLGFTTTRGTTTLVASTAVTDASGVAYPGAWSAPTTPTRDTLVVSAGTGSGAITLRVPVDVVAGPVARVEVVSGGAPGDGTVLRDFTAPVFRIVDPYGKPMPNVLVLFASEPPATTLAPSTSRLPAQDRSDVMGLVRADGWYSRTLGTHTLRLLAFGDSLVRSAVITRTVAQPACAPIGVLPQRGSSPFPSTAFTVSGTLGTSPSAACADSMDRHAFALDSLRGADLIVTGDVDVRVVRAGSLADSARVMPLRPALPINSNHTFTMLLPAGEYEVVVSRRPPAVTASYTINLTTIAGGSFSAGCDTTWTAPVVSENVSPSCSGSYPDAGLPAPAVVAHYGVAGIPAAGLTLRADMQITSIREDQPFTPVIAIYGRDAAGVVRLLGSSFQLGSGLTATAQVPSGYREAIIVVGRPLGQAGVIDLRLQSQ